MLSILGGTHHILHGHRLPDDLNQVTSITEYAVAQLSDVQSKVETFNRLHRMLQFLRSNVTEGRTYLLRRHVDNTTKMKKVYLYEVVCETDVQKLTFITQDIIDRLAVRA